VVERGASARTDVEGGGDERTNSENGSSTPAVSLPLTPTGGGAGAVGSIVASVSSRLTRAASVRLRM